ncbi:extracellular solute-binding protein [Natrialba swarupiae]|uniref:Extracellular solute-binding protein n=2 Tax=Natrialba swarupiae TaxID=2448032 RepID=A0A5D5AKY2_9EURY|nr:extracellular solute-binding protein [Natrialba swarupiae]
MADEINVWTHGTLPPAWEAAADEYTAENDGVTINIEELGFDENISQYNTAVASGQGAPSIGIQEGRDTPGMIARGGLADISGMMSDGAEDVFVDWKWAPIEGFDGDGIYGLPMDTAPVVTFYNRSMYDQAGFAPEDIETYYDLIDLGEELDDDQFVLSWAPEMLGIRWEIFYRQKGEQIYTEDGALNIDTDATAEIAEVMLDLYEADVMDRTDEFTESWFAALNDDRYATVTSGAWMAGALEDSLEGQDGNWGMHRCPALHDGDARASNHGGSSVVFASQLDDAEIARAYDFAEFFLTDTERCMMLGTEAGVFPANEETYSDSFWEEPQEYFDGQSYELILEVAEEVPELRYHEEHAEVLDEMETQLEEVLQGNVAPNEIGAQAQEAVADRTGLDTA